MTAMQRAFLLALVALAGTATARFGRGLLAANKNEHFITFDNNLLIAQCGDNLIFTGTPEVQLLRDALCDPSAIERPEQADSGEIVYTIPPKSVGRIVFSDRDCMHKDAQFQEVQVVCEVHFADAVDSVTEQPLTGDEMPGRGRQLIAFEHEVDWNNGGPYEPLEVTCGDSVSFAWKRLTDGKKSSRGHSMWYLPDGECPLDYTGPNATALQLHQLDVEGQYDLQLPLIGEFSLTIADGSMDGMSCFTGHKIEIIVSCPWANSTEVKFIPAPAPNQDKPLFDASFFYLDDSLLGPAPGPEAETPALAPPRKTPPAPAPNALAPAPEGPGIPDYALEYLDKEEERSAPAPAPGPEAELQFVEFEDPRGGIPKPKSEELYNYDDYAGAPAPAPGMGGEEATYTYFYEETPAVGPNGTAIVRRIKRKSGEALPIEAAQPPIPEARTFPNFTSSTPPSNAAADMASSRMLLSVVLGALALLALML